MFRRFILTCAALGLARLGAAQAAFQPGYIISAADDTLRGEIYTQGARTAARQVRFRPQAGAAEQVYPAATVRAYGLANGRRWETHRVLGRPSAPNAAPDPASESVYLLEVVTRGRLTLYYLVDESRQERFFVSGPEPLPELLHFRTQVEQNGRRYWQETPVYRSTLAPLMADCPAVQSQLGRVGFGLHQLAAVMKRYNECVAPAAAAAPAVRNQLKLSGVVGYRLSNRLNLGDASGRNEENHQYHGSAGWQGGLSLHLALRRRYPRLSLQLAALYDPRLRYEHTRGPQSGEFFLLRSVHTEMEFDYLRLPLTARYTWPGRRVAPFVQAGFTSSYLLKLRANRRTLTFEAPYTTREEVFIPEVPRYQPGLTAGAGVQIGAADGRTIALLLKGELSGGLRTNSSFGTAFSLISLQASYDLVK